MKIIADMGGGKFLIEAHSSEIANIIGVWGADAADTTLTRSISSGYGNREFMVGATFSISPAYQWLAKMKEQRSSVLKATGVMRAFLDHVESTVPEIVPPVVLSPADVAAREKVGD